MHAVVASIVCVCVCVCVLWLPLDSSISSTPRCPSAAAIISAVRPCSSTCSRGAPRSMITSSSSHRPATHDDQLTCRIAVPSRGPVFNRYLRLTTRLHVPSQCLPRDQCSTIIWDYLQDYMPPIAVPSQGSVFDHYLRLSTWSHVTSRCLLRDQCSTIIWDYLHDYLSHRSTISGTSVQRLTDLPWLHTVVEASLCCWPPPRMRPAPATSAPPLGRRSDTPPWELKRKSTNHSIWVTNIRFFRNLHLRKARLSTNLSPPIRLY